MSLCVCSICEHWQCMHASMWNWIFTLMFAFIVYVCRSSYTYASFIHFSKICAPHNVYVYMYRACNCIYMCVCVWFMNPVYTNMHAYTHKIMHTNRSYVNTYWSTYMYTGMQTYSTYRSTYKQCIHTYMHTYWGTYTNIYSTGIHTYIYTGDIRAYMHTYVHTYIQT